MIHSFPTMYILGGGRCGRNGSNQGFRPKIRPKTRVFGRHKYGLSHFRVAWLKFVKPKLWLVEVGSNLKTKNQWRGLVKKNNTATDIIFVKKFTQPQFLAPKIYA